MIKQLFTDISPKFEKAVIYANSVSSSDIDSTGESEVIEKQSK